MLACLHFNGERSMAGAFHLLQGKRSAQTIQDAAFYQALPLFGIYPNMEYSEFEKIAKKLEQTKLIESMENVHSLTEKGKAVLQNWLDKNEYIDQFNGWKYGRIAPVFWERFTLFIQTLSHIEEGKRFVPITDNLAIQRFVKQHLPKTKEARMNVRRDLYSQCVQLISTQSLLQQEVFVWQLSRPGRVGSTKTQLANQLNIPLEEISIRHASMVHGLIHAIQADSFTYPLLKVFTEVERAIVFGTVSAQKTAQLLTQISDVNELAKFRKLKKATIEDHLVELALFNESFQISTYVDPQKQTLIERASNKEQTLKLKKIHERLEKQVSYFEIRLVLARKGWNTNVRR